MKTILSSVLVALFLLIVAPVNADDRAVMKAFTENPSSALVESFDKQRDQHKILFYMGVVLLISIFATASLGLAMVLHGKQVFVAHMISAGFTVFLSIVHAVAAVVWFFPFK